MSSLGCFFLHLGNDEQKQEYFLVEKSFLNILDQKHFYFSLLDGLLSLKPSSALLNSVFQIWIRRIHIFWGLLDLDP